MPLEDQIENRKPGGRNFRQEPGSVKTGFTQARQWFSQFKLSRPSEVLDFCASFQIGFKDGAQGRPQDQMKQVWKGGAGKPIISQVLTQSLYTYYLI